MTLIATPRPDDSTGAVLESDVRPMTVSARSREAWRWTDMAAYERNCADAALRDHRAGVDGALGDYQHHLSNMLRYRRRAAEVLATPIQGRKS